MDFFRNFAWIVIWLFVSGRGGISQVTGSTWHEKFNWKAEEYFTDPKIIALCQAIQANDLEEIDRQIAAGADVNAKGKDEMTPLLWAFPDNKLERFTKLLEHGADPNVFIQSDLNTHGEFHPGDSVTHFACRTEFPGYFEAVFAHGGDPNLPRTTGNALDESPLFSVITGMAPDKMSKVKILIEKGADLNHLDKTGMTPTMAAVGWGGQFDIAQVLLEAGADPRVYQSNQIQKLSHVVARQESGTLKYATANQKSDYDRLVKWLDDHGESIDHARADLKRWASWNNATGEFRRNIDAEIAARKARDAREKAER
jgi:uncharacterized protein